MAKMLSLLQTEIEDRREDKNIVRLNIILRPNQSEYFPWTVDTETASIKKPLEAIYVQYPDIKDSHATPTEKYTDFTLTEVNSLFAISNFNEPFIADLPRFVGISTVAFDSDLHKESLRRLLNEIDTRICAMPFSWTNKAICSAYVCPFLTQAIPIFERTLTLHPKREIWSRYGHGKVREEDGSVPTKAYGIVTNAITWYFVECSIGDGPYADHNPPKFKVSRLGEMINYAKSTWRDDAAAVQGQISVDCTLNHFIANNPELDAVVMDELRFDCSPRGHNVFQRTKDNKDASIKSSCLILKDGHTEDDISQRSSPPVLRRISSLAPSWLSCDIGSGDVSSDRPGSFYRTLQVQTCLEKVRFPRYTASQIQSESGLQ
ncbi:hypothetical protein EDD21DRAFT_446332 [Dissophora ornata]|nr:hypothetical protein EDD21DRAFT_446332 [Dissophora ornata]